MKKLKLTQHTEYLIIVLFAIIPLFSSFPYRVNIFLSWEGAYRISQGQIPFADFGMPLGYGYWLIPALSFKLFGAHLLSLVKAQAFINVLAGISFCTILGSLGVERRLRIIAVFLFCLSYSFFNFWPWYNHSVIVYQLISIAFAMLGIMAASRIKKTSFLVLSGAFSFLAFFTKQDAGALAILLNLAIVLIDAIYEKSWRTILPYTAGLLILSLAIILPLSDTQFSYWFNYGQPPHTSRMALMDFADAFFYESQWIKFYLVVIALLIIPVIKSKSFYSNKQEVLFLFLTLAILAEAALFQVTSYTPPDNNIFFHSFAVSYILYLLSKRYSILNFQLTSTFLIAFAGIALWWSTNYWKYVNRILSRFSPNTEATTAANIHAVTKHNYKLDKDTTDVPMSQWKFTKRKGFEGIYMPPSTVDGIERVFKMEAFTKSATPRKILNLTELTPLAIEMQYEPEKGANIPLWHHRGVSLFDREIALYNARIGKKQYDLVLFEYLPKLNNFFPFEIRDSLLQHYNLVDSFHAPRRPTDSWIEVFVPKKP